MTFTRKFGEWVESYRNGFGRRPGGTEDGPIVLRIADVSSGEIDLSAPRRGFVSPKEAETYKLLAGDLLFIRVNGAREIVGRCCLVGAAVPDDTIFNDHLIRVRLKPGLDSEFARFCLGLPHARALIEKAAATSAGQLTISQQVLDSIDIPDLGLEKQRRIAHLIKAQLAAAADARQAVQAQLKDVALLAGKLRDQAMMDLGAFRRIPVEKVLRGIEAGKSFQTSERLASDKELGVLKVSAVSWGAFKPREAKAVEGDYTPDDRHRIRKGDVIVSRANTIALVGAVVRTERDYPQRLLSDKTLRLILDTTQCDPDYFVEALRLPEARAHIEANATGSSDSMRNISQGALAATPIPLPEIHEQRRLAKRMQAINHELTALRGSIQTRLDHVEQLPARLLAQVFDAL